MPKLSRSAISEAELYKRSPSKTVIKKIQDVYGIDISENSIDNLIFQNNELRHEIELLKAENSRLKADNQKLYFETEALTRSYGNQ
ncbi:MAG: hypothetical protein JW915_16580 [Chitinispirillaceae bacterium]|nr:hypothetical protein [Chitinispirillaceae bacterium]